MTMTLGTFLGTPSGVPRIISGLACASAAGSLTGTAMISFGVFLSFPEIQKKNFVRKDYDWAQRIFCDN
jgi:hypothetical protein